MTNTDLTILQGKTFSRILRLDSMPYVYKPITAITQAAPAVITSAGHGVLNNRRVAIVSVLGMIQINSPNNPPRSTDYHKATVIDPNTISINDINSAGFSAYTSGGYIQYLTPVDLTGASARMTLRDTVGGADLLDLTTLNSRITIDNTAKTITLTITSTDTALLTWTTGVYDLELIDNAGSISLLLSGGITVIPAVTLP